jgi:hypothetical protein
MKRIAETLAGIAGSGPSIFQARETAFVVLDGAFSKCATANHLHMPDDESDETCKWNSQQPCWENVRPECKPGDNDFYDAECQPPVADLHELPLQSGVLPSPAS